MEAKDIVKLVNEDLALGVENFGVSAVVGDQTGLNLIAGPYLKNSDPEYVTLRVTWSGVDTARFNAKRGYPDRVDGFTRGRLVAVKDLKSEEDVIREVHSLVLAAFSHDLREGLRLKSRNYDSPFHPHRPDGVRAWGDVDGDVAFFMQVGRDDVTKDQRREIMEALGR